MTEKGRGKCTYICDVWVATLVCQQGADQLVLSLGCCDEKGSLHNTLQQAARVSKEKMKLQRPRPITHTYTHAPRCLAAQGGRS